MDLRLRAFSLSRGEEKKLRENNKEKHRLVLHTCLVPDYNWSSVAKCLMYFGHMRIPCSNNVDQDLREPGHM